MSSKVENFEDQNNDNLLQHLLMGTWSVLAQDWWTAEDDPIPNATNNLASLVIEPLNEDTQSKNLVCTLYFKNPPAPGTSNPAPIPTPIPIQYDSNYRVFTDDNGACQISIWRHSSYDMIFGFFDLGGSKVLWSARRIPVTGGDTSLAAIKRRSADMDDLSKTLWHIRAYADNNKSTRGYVRFKALNAAEIINESIPIYGLFSYEINENNEPSKDGQLYDILTYDPRVDSYNSVFGVRSFAYSRIGTSAQGVVFATFNNKFSIPASHFIRTSGTDHETLLPFEREILMRRKTSSLIKAFNHNKPRDKKTGWFSDWVQSIDLGSLDDPNDPDVGVWIGYPPT